MTNTTAIPSLCRRSRDQVQHGRCERDVQRARRLVAQQHCRGHRRSPAPARLVVFCPPDSWPRTYERRDDGRQADRFKRARDRIPTRLCGTPCRHASRSPICSPIVTATASATPRRPETPSASARPGRRCTVPRSGFVSPAIMRSNVDLPQPLSPTIAEAFAFAPARGRRRVKRREAAGPLAIRLPRTSKRLLDALRARSARYSRAAGQASGDPRARMSQVPASSARRYASPISFQPHARRQRLVVAGDLGELRQFLIQASRLDETRNAARTQQPEGRATVDRGRLPTQRRQRRRPRDPPS